MPAYIVGQKLPTWKTDTPEGVHYNYIDGDHTIILTFDEITSREIDEFKVAPAEFYLRNDGGLITFVISIGQAFQGNAFYSWWVNPEPRRIFPQFERSPQQRSLVAMLLIERSTGVLKGIRTFTWSPDFCRTLESEIRRQAASPSLDSQDWYETAIAALYQKYPQVIDTIDEEVLVFCRAGD